MKNMLKVLLEEFEKLNIEEISSIAFSPFYKNSQKILHANKYYTDNIRYPISHKLYVLNKKNPQNFYIRSIKEEENSKINLLLYSHFKQLKDEGVIGVFSIGDALNEDFLLFELLICQIIDTSFVKDIRKVFQNLKVEFTEYTQINFGSEMSIFLVKYEKK